MTGFGCGREPGEDSESGRARRSVTMSSRRVGRFALMVVLADKVPALHDRRASFQRLAYRLLSLTVDRELTLLPSGGSDG